MQSPQLRNIERFLLCLGFIWIMLGVNFGLNIYDEANPLLGAMRLLNGEIPYRDFWTMYAPGQYYLLAGFISFGGFFESVLAVRLLSALFMYFTCYSIFKTSKLIYPGSFPIAVFTLSLLYASLLNFSGRGILTAALLSSLGLYRFMLGLNSAARCKLNFGLSGGLFGLAVCFRHDFAVYVLLFGVISFILPRVVKSFRRITVTEFLIFSGFTLICCVPFYVYIVSIAGFDNVYSQLIEFSSKVFPAYRNLPFPLPFIGNGMFEKWNGIVFYIPHFLFIMYLLRVFRFKIETRYNLQLLSVVMLFSLLLLNQATVRSDFEHAGLAIIFSFVTLPFLIKNLKTDNREVFAYFLVIVMLTVPPFFIKIQRVITSYNMRSDSYISCTRGTKISLSRNLVVDYDRAIRYIEYNSNPGNKIFICNDANDRTTVNDMMLYYLSSREPATKYHELHPGLTTVPEIQTQIVRDLERNKVNLVVRVRGNYQPENNLSSLGGSKILDNYINSNFELYDIFGNYAFYFRNYK